MNTIQYLVTIRLPKNPRHNPHRKLTGICPASGGTCTDVTGEHHTYLLDAVNIDEAESYAKVRLPDGAHITRIETVY